MPVYDAVENSVAHSACYDAEDVTYNPFASSPNTSSFSLSLNSPSRKGLHRRRTSEQAQPGPTNATCTSTYAKSQTAQETNGHPLGSDVIASTSSLHDYGITRPRLTRLIRSDPEETNNKPSPDLPVVQQDEEDRLVLIHEVSPSDTLAGVAIIYGISMADLRKANQLWTSDSIHLRKILHIPLNRASNLKHLRDKSHSLHVSEANESPVSLADTVPSLNIHRIPASRLSFFPPTSQIYPDDSSGVTSFTTLRRRYKPPDTDRYPNNADESSSRADVHTPGTFPNIPSIFSALPRGLPSSREGIISRLSLDSNSTSGAPSSDGQEHELDELDGATTRRRTPTAYDPGRNSNSATGSSVQFPSGVTSVPTIHPIAKRVSQINSYVRTRGGQYAVDDELSVASTAIVRTSQLEPSPEMHLPILVGRKSEHAMKLDLDK